MQDGVLVSRDLSTARRLFDLYLSLNETIFFLPRNEAANMFLSVVLRRMLEIGLLSREDLLDTDDTILTKIRMSRFSPLLFHLEEGFVFEQVASKTRFVSR